MGQKFPQIRSMSYRFRDIFNVLFSRNNPRWPLKVAKTEIFALGTRCSCTTLQVKNLLEVALSLTVSKIFSVFYFLLKSKMAAKSGENLNFSFLHGKLLYYTVGQKFAQNHSIPYCLPRYLQFFTIR